MKYFPETTHDTEKFIFSFLWRQYFEHIFHLLLRHSTSILIVVSPKSESTSTKKSQIIKLNNIV